jgi:DNA processing protein
MSGACGDCLRSSWLRTRLNAPLDYCARDLSRFWRVLELSDVELIEALGGRRREELHAAYAHFEAKPVSTGESVEALCRHHCAYPASLRETPLAPPALWVRGGSERLGKLLDRTVVAIVGTRRASDYGMETARGLARGLAAAGVTVTSGLCEGISVAVHSGALEAGDSMLSVMAGSVERCSPAWCASLYQRVTNGGCAISEAPPQTRVRAWREPARACTLALLARIVIVVEAEERPWALACAGVARDFDRCVAAVPGRVSSPASRGTNALLMDGARLVRDPQDVLDLLHGIGADQACDSPPQLADPRLRAVLDQVADGNDTVAKLTESGAPVSEVTLALAELELRGLLVRGDGGRYLPRAGLRVG